MATKYLTSSKVDDIISHLIKPVSDEKAAAKNNINEVICNILIKYVDPEIKAFAEKHPSSIRYMDDISFKIYREADKKDWDSEWFYVHFNKLVPNIELPSDCNDRYKYIMDLINNVPDDKKAVEEAIDNYVALYHKRKEIKAQLRCAIGQFKTYNQLKDNYPEAYKVLLENVDREVVITGNGCDNLELVRAKLSKYNKIEK